MRKIIFIALWAVVLSSCTSGGGESSVKATIKNLQDGDIIVRVSDTGDQTILLDTTICSTNGKFSFSSRFSEPIHVIFMPKSGVPDTKKSKGVMGRNSMKIELYMFKGEHYTMKGSVDKNILLYSVEGSEMNSVLADLRTKYIDVHRHFDMLAYEQMQGQVADSLRVLNLKINETKKAEMLEYVKTNLESQLSGLFLSNFYLSKQDIIDFDTYYPQISESVRTGLFKNQIELVKQKSDLVVNSKIVRAGTQSIDFTLNGLDGETITLSSYKGKNVLLYFWGTW